MRELGRQDEVRPVRWDAGARNAGQVGSGRRDRMAGEVQ